MSSKALGSAAVAATLLFAAGCGDDEDKNGTGASSNQGAAQEGVRFIAPTSNQTIKGNTVAARVALSGFRLDPKDVGKANKPGQGHLHFSMDGGRYDTPKYSGANGQLAVKLGVDGKYSPAVAPNIVYKGIPAGAHTLRVDLVNNDHSPTGKYATVKFRVG